MAKYITNIIAFILINGGLFADPPACIDFVTYDDVGNFLNIKAKKSTRVENKKIFRDGAGVLWFINIKEHDDLLTNFPDEIDFVKSEIIENDKNSNKLRCYYQYKVVDGYAARINGEDDPDHTEYFNFRLTSLFNKN